MADTPRPHDDNAVPPRGPPPDPAAAEEAQPPSASDTPDPDVHIARYPESANLDNKPGDRMLAEPGRDELASGYLTPMEEHSVPFFSQVDPGSGDHVPMPIRRVRTQRDMDNTPGTGTITSPSSSPPRPAIAHRSSSNSFAAVPPPPQLHHRRTAGTDADLRASLNGLVSKPERPASAKVSIKDRIACYRWTFFTMTMATGGMANVLHSLAYSPQWIITIGIVFCLLNIVLFVINCVCLTMRFVLKPGSFTQSFTDQVESLFIPSFFVSIGMILLNVSEYGVPHTGPWLIRAMEVMFWMYTGASVLASAGLYLVLWSTQIFPVHMMTPTWVFPAYPLLLTAPFAGNLIASADKAGQSLYFGPAAIAFGAATTQGAGCLIAFMISAAFMYRLMTQKLPRDMQRPGVFISIGPFGFTAGGIAQLGTLAHLILPAAFRDIPNAAPTIKLICILVSLWLWGLALWFFLVSVGSLWKYALRGHSMPFQMTWWSFVFPNTALITATETIGGIFESSGVQMLGNVLTICLMIVYIIVFLTMLHCLRTRKLLWPKDSS